MEELKNVLFYSNEGPHFFPRGDNAKIEISIYIDEASLGEEEMKDCVLFQGEIIKKIMKMHQQVIKKSTGWNSTKLD